MTFSLTLQNLGISYPGRVILESQSVTFGPGTHILRGSNGAGKSSMLRAIAGVHSSYTGDIRFGEFTERNSPEDYRRAMFYSGSDDLSIPWLAPVQYRDLIMQLYPNFDNQRWDSLVLDLALSSMETQKLSKLSLGTRRKFQHVLALSSGASLLVFDEPFNGLDAASFHYLQTAINNELDHGRVILLVTHQLPTCLVVDEFWELNNAALINSDGPVTINDSPSEILDLR